MMPNLTEEQRQAIRESGGQPVCVVDPKTNESYVLLPAEEYARIQSYLQVLFESREAYPLVDQVMAEDDANDPTLESYQSLSQRQS